MRPLRVCIYGGTDRQGTPIGFVEALSYELLSTLAPSVIVTGGFRHSSESPDAISTDAAALDGASRYARTHDVDLREIYEACMPEQRLDDRRKGSGAVRMTDSDGIMVRRIDGTPTGRRLSMVRDVDAVVTISGGPQTELVIEQAIALGLPTVPIPDGGGASKRLLGTYRGRIATGFAPGALDETLLAVAASIDGDPTRAARAVVELLRRARLGRCLVLMPFDEEHNERYDDVVAPAVEQHMQPVRLDRLESSTLISANLAAEIDGARALVADITATNDSVMYEIGYAHGRGLQPLLFTFEASRLEDLPVYLQTVNVHVPRDDEELGNLIGDHLEAAKQPRP